VLFGMQSVTSSPAVGSVARAGSHSSQIMQVNGACG
jgi:hypothetical protein